MDLISIVIPVEPSHNRPAFLGACLTSLSSQTVPHGTTEVVIIGDGCEIDKGLLPPGMRYVIRNSERPRGVLAARNEAIGLSNGGLIAFMDADCVADAAWLEKISQGLDAPGIAGASGTIQGADGRDVYRDRIRSEDYVLPCSGMGNILFKRPVLAEAGLFDERLCFGAEEADLCWRVYLKGYRIRHAPDAVVRHPTVRDAKDFFCYGVATRLLTEKYGKILGISPLPELMRLARHPGMSDGTAMPSRVIASLAKPFVVAAGYLQRAALESCRLVPRVDAIDDLDAVLSKTAERETALTLGSKKVSRPNSVIWWSTEGGCIVRDLKRRRDYMLDSVAAAIWTLLDAGNSKESVIDTLAGRYDESREKIERDFDGLVSQCIDNGVLKTAEGCHALA